MSIYQRFLLLIIIITVLIFINLASAFVVIPSSASSMLQLASSRQGTTVSNRLAPLSQARSNDLPLEEYKKTATVMLELLHQANDLVQQIESLTANLESCQARDPDIADDSSTTATATASTTRSNRPTTTTNSRLSSSSSSGGSSSGSNTTRSNRLYHAVQRAVQAVDHHGRYSRQAEQAWQYVSHVLLSDKENHHHHHVAYLQHPSYRYRYAQHLITQERQQRQSSWNIEQMHSHSQTIMESVQHMKESLQLELDRFQDRELVRLALVRSWTE